MINILLHIICLTILLLTTTGLIISIVDYSPKFKRAVQKKKEYYYTYHTALIPQPDHLESTPRGEKLRRGTAKRLWMIRQHKKQ